MSRMIGRALGSVVSPIVEYVDVDGVVQRIDIDEVLQRVDFDALLDGVDFNRHLDRVDVNRHLSRVDVDAIMDRVDVQGLLDRTDLAAVISQSSTGVFTSLLDAMRIQIALLDQAIHSLSRFRLCCSKSNRWKCRSLYEELPPAPGFDEEEPRTYPKRTAHRAVALQGRHSGVVSGAIGYGIDQLIIALVFAIFVWVTELFIQIFSKDGDWRMNMNSNAYAIVYACWNFVYFAGSLMLTSRTIGRATVGIMLVGRAGEPINFLQAMLHALCIPLTLAVFGWVLMLVFKDRMGLHHWLSCTASVYSWDAKAARIRDKDVPDFERVQPVFASIDGRRKPKVVEESELPPV